MHPLFIKSHIIRQQAKNCYLFLFILPPPRYFPFKHISKVCYTNGNQYQCKLQVLHLSLGRVKTLKFDFVWINFRVIQCVSLGILIESLNEPSSHTTAYVSAAALILSAVIYTAIFHAAMFSSFRLGFRTRVGLSYLVYQKVSLNFLVK